MIGKLVGKILAAPVKVATRLPDEAADAVEEVSKALDPRKPKGKR